MELATMGPGESGNGVRTVIAPRSALGSSVTLHAYDITVLVVYFVFVICVGVWVSSSRGWGLAGQSSIRASRGTIGGYFLAGRSMSWWPIGASLMSSNVGSGLFIGLAGTGAAGGLAVGGFEWNATWLLLALGWIFVPVYIAAGVVTMPQYLKKRFGGQRIQTDIFSGALFIQMALGWDLYLSTAMLLVVTAVYTIAGGLRAVIYTDALQTVIMVGGALVLMFLGFQEVGWYPGLEQRYRQAIPHATVPNTTCHLPRSDAFHMLRDPVSGDIPWPGLVFGLTVLATWCWCTDQVIVQRSLSAKNLSHAKGGSVLGGYLKILPMFFIVMPGMISRALYPDEVGCVDPDVCQRICGARVSCSNIAYPKLVIALMPVGLRGLMIAVILAALMSSLTSIFNSSGTLFAIDVWLRLRKKATEQELMVVGRVFVVFLVVISILWIPIIQSSNSGQLFDYIQSVTSYLAPPITALFLLAIFCKRVTEPVSATGTLSLPVCPRVRRSGLSVAWCLPGTYQTHTLPPLGFCLPIHSGAFWGLIFGLVVGLLRMILEFSYPVPACGEVDQRPAVLKDFHYLYFALLLCGLTAVVIVAISLCTTPIPEEKASGVLALGLLKMLSLPPGPGIRPLNFIPAGCLLCGHTHLARLTWWTRNCPHPELEKEAPEGTPGTSEMPSGVSPPGDGGRESSNQGQDQHGAPRRRWGRLLWDWFCGLAGHPEPTLSPEEMATHQWELTSIAEEPLWRSVCDVNAILLLAINIFLWGYFA
ncbi:hypothetical protein GH733_015369 [Mirounga leonina]|nr:hypothetical protein GH733_015369 [Mirounga leonina]